MDSFQLTLNADERDYLRRILEANRKGEKVEEHRTDSLAYREKIKSEIVVIEGLLAKLSAGR
ncbi:MAG TPA: hypothetical protein VGH74_21130 [Planctomycetaceae bacterium]|jgi:hypothetical protein